MNMGTVLYRKCCICGKDADIAIMLCQSKDETVDVLAYYCYDCYTKVVQDRGCLSCD
jgi:hypothetical protein